MKPETSKSHEIPLVVIHGPTASGKSDLAIRLAKKFNGEIISADSRQVYTGLDIGTGKVTKKERRSVRHHLLDVARPGGRFTVAGFKKLADSAIREIAERGKLPFLVGGSPLYVKAVVEGYVIPEVSPDWSYRSQCEALSLERLLNKLKKLDPATYARIDKKNPRRVIRALEIIRATGKPIGPRKKESPYSILELSIDVPRETLYRRIDERVDARVKRGMIREVERLIEQGVSKKWLNSLGLEYRCITEFSEKSKKFQVSSASRRIKFQESKREMLKRLKYAIHDFARRQLIWYRKMPDVQWIRVEREAVKAIREFIRARGSGVQDHRQDCPAHPTQYLF